MNKAFKAALILCLIAITSQAFSQTRKPGLILRDTAFYQHNDILNPSGKFIELKASAGISSNFLVKQLFFSNSWDSNLKEEQLSHLKPVNTLGISISADLRYTDYNSSVFGKDNLHWFTGVSSTNLGGLQLQDETTRLILNGNKNVRDISFNDHKNGLELLWYSDVYLGLSSHGKKSRFSGAIGFTVGHRLLNARLRSGEIITEDNGERVDIKGIKFKYEEAVSKFNSGNGFITNWNYSREINNGIVCFSLSDFGIIGWKNLKTYQPAHETFSYNGFYIDQFWNNDYSFSVQDSIEGNYIIKSEGTVFQMTPFLFNTTVKQSLGDKSYYHLSLSYRALPGYIPSLEVGVHTRFSKSSLSRWTTGFQAGGFGLAAVLFGTDLIISRNMSLSANIKGVENLIIPGAPVFWMANAAVAIKIQK
ncbi:MAG: hypothetical protein GC181_00435 [Bacteroidetes bacterium]|nr:hypothetical protein [Bacteroidota bacterium]